VRQTIHKAGISIAKKVVLSPPVKSFVAYTKRVALPGFDDLPIFYVADFFFTGIQRGSIVMRAQSLAFSFFLAIFPATIFLFSLIPYLPFGDFQDQLLEMIRGFLPSNAYASARSTIEDIIKIQHGGLLSFGAYYPLVC
jgi:membrane protein